MRDPEGQCEDCPKWTKIERFSEEFRAFMGYMTNLFWRQRAGWRIRNNDLTLDEWFVLARIQEYYEMKREAEILALGHDRGRK